MTEVNDVNDARGQEAGNKYFAAVDAARRNEANAANFTDDQIAAGLALVNEVSKVFFRRKVYLNYRKKTMVVKIAGARPMDLVTTDAVRLEQSLAARGMKMRRTGTGTLITVA